MVAVGKRLVSLIHWAEIKSDEARGTPKRSLLSFPTLGSSFFFFESTPLQTRLWKCCIFLLFFFSSLGYFLFSSLLFSFFSASEFILRVPSGKTRSIYFTYGTINTSWRSRSIACPAGGEGGIECLTTRCARVKCPCYRCAHRW